MALVSIIVAIYNKEQYLACILESRLSQQLHNIEIICVDEGTTDRSGWIADEYAKRDARIRVIHKQNDGQVNAWKTGTFAS